MKKLLSVFLLIAFLLSSLPISVFALNTDIVAEGTCGENLVWTLTDDGTLTISGQGAMEFFYMMDQEYLAYSEQITNVIIESGVTLISADAFEFCSNIKSISIPDSVTSIYDWAFRGTGITKISIPASVTYIGVGIVEACTELAEIEVNADNQYYHSKQNCLIETGTKKLIAGCKTSIIPTDGSVTVIGEDAFMLCTELTEISIPDCITEIGDCAFSQCRKLEKIHIPSSVKRIGRWAFEYCNNLKQVTFANDGENIEDIGSQAFTGTPFIKDPVNTVNGFIYINHILLTADKDLVTGAVTIKEGTTVISSNAFDGCSKITSVSIPDSVTSIGEYAFRGCTGLKEITLPDSVISVGTYAFSDCTSLMSAKLSNGMKKIPDSMFDGCTAFESVTFPENLEEIGSWAFYDCDFCRRWSSGVYTSMNFYIPDTVKSIGASAFRKASSVYFSVFIGKGVKYIGPYAFEGVNLYQATVYNPNCSIGAKAFSGSGSYNYIYGYNGSTAQTYANSNGLSFKSLGEHEHEYDYEVLIEGSEEKHSCYCGEYYTVLIDTNSLTVNLTDESENQITDGFEINWYEAETGAKVGTGKTLNSVDQEKQYYYEILLNEELGKVYYQPETTLVSWSEDNDTFTVALEKIQMVDVSGIVTDENGTPVKGVQISFNQIYNNKYEDCITVISNENGIYQASICNVYTKATFSFEGYYNKIKTVISEQINKNTVEMGTISLVKLPENKISLSLKKQTSTQDGQAASSITLNNTNGLSFALYNRTQNKAIADFVVQGLNIVLGENTANPSDIIEISVTDEKKQMTAEKVSVSLDESMLGQAEIVFVENGSINISQIIGSEKTTIVIFDRNGNFVSSSIASDSYESIPLPAGTYTLAFMQKTDLFRSPESIGVFAELGFKENTDYVKTSIEITNGKINVIDTVSVPTLDESNFYYTVKDKTGMSVSATEVAAGKYLTVRAEYQIDPKYSSGNETISIVFPAGVEPAGGSLSLDGKIAPYSFENNTLTVYTSKNKGTIRLYAVAGESGTYNLNSYLSFDLSSGLVKQSIGTAEFEATSAKITLPKKTGRKTVSVEGITFADATVNVFDNGTFVGTVKANKNGKWSLKFDLIKPYGYSYHDVYATIESERLSGVIKTDTEILCYDKNYIDVSKVTMYNTAHPEDSLKTVEYTTVFDFLNPSVTPSYRYWPSYPDFTFEVEFTGGDDSVLSDVYVVTTDDSGEKIYIPCSYDEMTGLWIGIYSFNSSEVIPATVRVAYNLDNFDNISSSVSLDTQAIKDYKEIREKARENIIDISDDIVMFEVVEDNDEYFELEITDNETDVVLANVIYMYCDYGELDLSMDYISLGNESDWECAHVDNDGIITYYFKNDKDRVAFVYSVILRINILENYAKKISNDNKMLRLSKSPALQNATFLNENTLNEKVLKAQSDLLDRKIKTIEESDKLLYGKPNPQQHLIDEYKDIKEALGNYGDINDTFDQIYDTIGYYQLRSLILATKEDLLEIINNMRKLIFAKCPDGSYKLSTDDIKKYARLIDSTYDFTVTQMDAVLNTLENFRSELLWSNVHKLALSGLNAISKVGKANQFKFGKRVKMTSKNVPSAGYFFTKKEREILGKISDFNSDLNAAKKNISLLKKSNDNCKELFESDYVDFINDDIVNGMQDGFNKFEDFLDEVSNRLNPNVEIGIENVRASLNGTEGMIRNQIEYIRSHLLADYKKCGGDFDEPSEPQNTTPPSPTKVILDPSGYVYEAVPSNRVEGVKAEIYYYDYELDEFGMPAEEKSDILWDAENYDQINPLYTDANGEYAWDVPMGQWLVKFSKDGYYDADSKSVYGVDKDGYLPVPPPQTEVNVGIVSKNAPTVKNISVYENEVRIEFSQYVQPATVNANNVKIRMNGKIIEGTITPVNAEYDYEHINQYATIFTFSPSISLSGNVNVSVDNVKNYAGKAMDTPVSKGNHVEVKPESITVIDNISIAYNSGALLEIAVLPNEIGAGQILTVESSSPSIVGIANNTVITDENGCANVMLLGNLPGQSEITVSLPGTDLNKKVLVEVNGIVSVQDRCEKVKANIISGTTVEKGALLELSSATEDAEIYYTLDGTCPCTVGSASRLKYTSPISVNDDTFIIAYAVKEGLQDSYTAGYTFYVAADPELKLIESSIYTLSDIYVSDISTSTTVAKIRSQFSNDNVVIRDSNGNVLSDDTVIGSGFIICLLNGNEVIDERMTIVEGDVNGDGEVDIFDFFDMVDCVNGDLTLEGAKKQAGLFVNDDEIDIFDTFALLDYINGEVWNKEEDVA